MWCTLDSRLSDETIDSLLNRAIPSVATSESNEIVSSGKNFFLDESGDVANLDLLTSIHSEVWPELAGNVEFNTPVVDHCYLLVKNSGAAVTRLHQDRPYWVRKEAVPSIFSVWIALKEISSENGGLMLSRENEVGTNGISAFNTGSLLEHEMVSESSGSFPLLIPQDVASEMVKSMQPVVMAKGEAIAFDSFEPHLSSANTSGSPRLAMKIAYAEGEGNAHHLVRVDELES